MTIRRAAPEDAARIARLHRASFNAALPHLKDLHTPDEDLWFFGTQILPTHEVWVSLDGTSITGFVAVSNDWLNHLYIAPHSQGCGHGSRLLRKATEHMETIQLWTFQINVRARAFYERHGFHAVEFTDGTRNEEKEPDVRYVRNGSVHSFPEHPR